MNFDTTSIAVRERGFAEIMDLAVRVAWAHAGPLLLALVAGAGPWMLLNALLLQDALDSLVLDGPFVYLMPLAVLIILQTPLATGLVTLYLGQITFSDRVDARRILMDYLRSLPQMIVKQGVLRCLCLPLVITLVLPYASWPYLSELILLERNPMFGRKGRLTTRKRSRNLHRNSGGDLFVRWMASAFAGLLLIVALCGAFYTLATQFSEWRPSARFMLSVIVPVAAWLVVGFFTVVRFLSYLDLRIRGEGWEVELTMRAEAARLERVAP